MADSGAENQDPQNAGDGSGAGQIPNLFPPGSISTGNLIQSTPPPRGKDPQSHHRDADATLLAAHNALANSIGVPPKILSQAHAEPSVNAASPAAARSGSGQVLAKSTTHAPTSSGRGSDRRGGVTEINKELVTEDFLAAAAQKFYSSSAEDLVQLIVPVVPFFAACRSRWVSKNFSGASLVLTEKPEAVAALVQSWTKDSGERLLTDSEIEAVIYLISGIVHKCKNNPPVATAWAVLWAAKLSKEASELPKPKAFEALTSDETFQFVLARCPHLLKLGESWNVAGITGLELMEMAPVTLMEILSTIHEFVPDCPRLLPHACHRVIAAISAAFRLNFNAGLTNLASISRVYEEYDQNYTKRVLKQTAEAFGQLPPSHGGGSAHGGGGARETIATPTATPLSSIYKKSACPDSVVNLDATISGQISDIRIDGQGSAARKLFEGTTSFMSELGTSNSSKGTKLFTSVTDGATVLYID